ncbi:MAG TPA: hypothetical protein VLL74_07885 [Methanoregula sp.]|nr:hypothetical protein [Methanoregula sp.]
MDPADALKRARELMEDFAVTTGLDPPHPQPRRYLWTDAFAVCNYLGFFQQTGDPYFRELALRLIGQVHHTLGRHRNDDPRTGWISGLAPDEGELHPAIGGLRIGKSLPERGPGEPYNEEREWDRDGQYYHYLTKWMHALGRAGAITGNPVYTRWAVELARTAHARFTYRSGSRMRMYWKMSIDLSRPLVPSMGQHDPLDGLLTYAMLRRAAGGDAVQPVLAQEMADMAGMVRDMPLATSDPLGIGGLLSDRVRIARLSVQGDPVSPGLLEPVTAAALDGLGAFVRTRSLELPAGYRLAFRELGLAIGLAGTEQLRAWMPEHPHRSVNAAVLQRQEEELQHCMPLKQRIEEFWLQRENQASATWKEHREINTVMLATSLAPGGFLAVPEKQ